jgi:hypothetical protein
MATLTSLKLTAAQKSVNLPAVQVRRNKLLLRLAEQQQMAGAQQAGEVFSATKLRLVKDADTGAKKQILTSKRVKPWWFVCENGKLALGVRYGARLLELGKGKFAVEIASQKELLPTLDLIKTAILDGELDAAMETASGRVRAGFAK